jgi:L-rhamnose mutarotase
LEFNHHHLTMFTLGLAMQLRPGSYEQYKLAHDQLWPELAEGMNANQVSMAIYLDGDRLFLFATAPSEAHWQRSRQCPILARWDARMTELLETNEQGGIAFSILPKTFGFGEFK